MSLKICTYNMGSNVNDYELFCRYRNPNFKQEKATEAKFQSDYQTAQNYVAVQLQGQADVYCLQEVTDETRPLIKSLKEKGFTIHKISRPYFDCAVALSPQFEDIENRSKMLEGGDVALVITKHQPTQEKIIFVSAHMAGFTLDGILDQDSASYGYKYCAEIADLLDGLAKDTLQIIGADVNVFPERQSDRFELLKKRGFKILRTGEPTNVMPTSSSYPTRELDFFFYRTPHHGILSSLLKKEKKGEILPQKVLNFEDPLKNASDHLPIFSLFH